MTDTPNVEVVSEDNPYLEDMKESLKSAGKRAKADYNEYLTAYNKTRVGGMIIMHFPKGSTLGNIKRVFEFRGLKFREDYLASRAPQYSRKKSLAVCVKRLSVTSARIIKS